MWICTNVGFISIVQDRNDNNKFVVRARKKEHLELIFNNDEPIETPHADYRWRLYLTRKVVIDAVNEELSLINYDNFKNSVEDGELHDAYAKVWSIMYSLQRVFKSK